MATEAEMPHAYEYNGGPVCWCGTTHVQGDDAVPEWDQPEMLKLINEQLAEQLSVAEATVEHGRELHDCAYAVWMAFIAGTAEELSLTLQNLSAFMYAAGTTEEK